VAIYPPQGTATPPPSCIFRLLDYEGSAYGLSGLAGLAQAQGTGCGVADLRLRLRAPGSRADDLAGHAGALRYGLAAAVEQRRKQGLSVPAALPAARLERIVAAAQAAVGGGESVSTAVGGCTSVAQVTGDLSE
jgi:hypothetical protein